MNTQREATQREKEGIANAVANNNKVHSTDNEVPSLEQVSMGDHISVVRQSILEARGMFYKNLLLYNGNIRL